MESDDEYDEFGNYIGHVADRTHSESDDQCEDPERGQIIDDGDDSDEENQGALIKVDDNVDVFQAAETIYVDPTNTGTGDPVIKAVLAVNTLEYKIKDDELPQTTYSKDYLTTMAKTQPERVRTVAVVGGLHTGKTSFLDTLVMQTHPDICPSKRDEHNGKPMRYLDTHKIENERGVSIRNAALSLLCQDLHHRSHPVNFIDCPGSPDFQDDLESALGVVEGAVLIIDAVEGLTGRDRMILTELVRNNLRFVVVLNKFDRLILELRLAPRDFYLKIKHTLDGINSCLYHNEYAYSYTHEKLISPLKGNVVFASYNLRTSFTLATWSRFYEQSGRLPNVDVAKFEKLLWGKVSFDNGQFSKVSSPETPSSFEKLIVGPLYKLVTHALVSEPSSNELAQILWDHFHVSLHKSTYKQDPQVLLREVFSAVFPDLADFTQAVVDTVPPPSPSILSRKGLPDIDDKYPIAEVFAVRLAPDLNEFQCIARILLGTFRTGDELHIFTDTQKRILKIGKLHICCGRYNISVKEAVTGSIVMMEGLEDLVSKSASLFGVSCPVEQHKRFHRMANGAKSVFKVAVECENPVELPRLVRGLLKLSKVYPAAVIKLEESGEYTISGTGELFLDCVLHDLRYLTEDYLSIKVSDPMVRFSESCHEQSVTKLPAASASNQNRISIIAEPVKDHRLSTAVERGRINLSQPQKTTTKVLCDEFQWDVLAARSLWYLGPKGLQLPSMLLDDSLEGETDKKRLALARDSIVAGFELGVNEGPLCGEAIRDTKFKILDAVLGSIGIVSSSQVIPMTRNAVHIGLLTAAPKLLEPMYKVFTTCTYNCLSAIHTLLEKRRGWAVQERAIVGTKMYEVEGYVPVIDSVGLDVDIRLATQGQSFCVMEFCRWDTVPGDPLDKDCELPAMKPVPRASLARDFVMKTRKRKGLGNEPNLQRYIDPELYAKLRESDVIV